MTAEQYIPVVGSSVMGPLCYLGIDQDTPLGLMVDTTFNLQFTTANGISPQQINVSCWDTWFLTGIVFFGTGNVFLKVYDGQGEEIFTDFFLPVQSGTDPYPLIPAYPFQPNDNIRFDALDTSGGGNLVEVAFRGYTLGGV